MEHLGLAMHIPHESTTCAQFAFNLADLVTLIVFVVLGANIPFERAGRQPAAGAGRARGAAAGGAPAHRAGLRAARPRGRWTRNEMAFLCWTRETGVIPAALVGVLAGLGVPYNDVFASVVALAIVLTLLVQALPARWLAGRLGLLEPDAPASRCSDPGGGLRAQKSCR